MCFVFVVEDENRAEEEKKEGMCVFVCEFVRVLVVRVLFLLGVGGAEEEKKEGVCLFVVVFLFL